MRLYHFDASGDEETFATESRLLSSVEDARRCAFDLAFRLAGRPQEYGEDGGAVVVQAYTAEDGLVLIVRVVASVETTRPETG